MMYGRDAVLGDGPRVGHESILPDPTQLKFI